MLRASATCAPKPRDWVARRQPSARPERPMTAPKRLTGRFRMEPVTAGRDCCSAERRSAVICCSVCWRKVPCTKVSANRRGRGLQSSALFCQCSSRYSRPRYSMVKPRGLNCQSRAIPPNFRHGAPMARMTEPPRCVSPSLLSHVFSCLMLSARLTSLPRLRGSWEIRARTACRSSPQMKGHSRAAAGCV
ncbi:hypothetical protein D9M68_739850 [compost metagenome]